MQTVHLWLFPPADFALWQAECGGRGEIADYDAYCGQVDALARDAAARGWECRLVRLRVQTMLNVLSREDWENTSENRARVLADPEKPAGTAVLGLQIAPNAIGWALIGEPRRAGETEAPRLESVRDVARQLFDSEGGADG